MEVLGHILGGVLKNVGLRQALILGQYISSVSWQVARKKFGSTNVVLRNTVEEMFLKVNVALFIITDKSRANGNT